MSKSKKVTPQNNKSNAGNNNKGTSGTNVQNGKMHGNRSKQLEASKKNSQ